MANSGYQGNYVVFVVVKNRADIVSCTADQF